MTIFFQIAFRNLLRNRRRSLITLSAVAFGLSALIFLRGFIFGAQRQMVENVKRTLTGDAEIVPEGLESIYNVTGVIEDPESIRKILRDDPRILAFSEKVMGGGIVSSSTSSMASYIVGIDPVLEDAIGTPDMVSQGRLMTRDDEHGAVLGEKMRRILGVEIGDKIVVTVQDYFGALAGEAFTLIASFETGNEQIDNGTVAILLPAAQRLLSFDHRISKFVLRISSEHDVSSVVLDLRSKMTDPILKVVTWEDLIPFMAQMLKFQNGMILVVILIVLVVVAVGILNTLTMSIVERTREFGLMMALGTKSSQVVLLVALESFFITLFGSLLGVAGGMALITYFQGVGIDMERFTEALKFFLIGSRVYPQIDWTYLVISLGVVIVSNFVVSLYPAWRAGRLVPVEAMRQVG